MKAKQSNYCINLENLKRGPVAVTNRGSIILAKLLLGCKHYVVSCIHHVIRHH